MGLAQQAAGKPRGVQRQAQQMLNPVIAALTRAAMGRARRSEAAIQGFTDSYANQLGQIHSAAPYANAETGQASIDAALQQSLTGGGADLASQLAQRLGALQGSSGAGALAQESGQLASQGQSAGNTRLAAGSASLSALLANAANAGSYDQKLPGLAKLSGLQGIKQAEGAATSAIDQGTLSAESQLPSLIHGLQAQRSENAYRQAQVQLGYGRLQIEQQNANTAAMRAAQTALSENRSYGVALARLGIENHRLQLEALKQEAAFRGGGLSPSELSRYKSMAYGLASEGFASVDTATGKPFTYQHVLIQMTEKGIPVSIAAKALARAGYAPGVRGTPSDVKRDGSLQGPLGPSKGLGRAYRQAGGAPFRRRRK